MGTIVISQNVSLDGVAQDPTGEEGFTRGGWFTEVSDRDREEWAKVALDEAMRAEALLLGRRSDQFFGSRWPSRSGELADRLNTLPKYVVSSTLEQPVWNNSTILTGDVVHAIAQLKEKLSGEILLYASRRLVHTLLENELIDQLRLMIYPVILGAGDRLLGETTDQKPTRLLETRTVGDSLAYLTYQLTPNR